MQREITFRNILGFYMRLSVLLLAAALLISYMKEKDMFFFSFSREPKKYCLVCFALCLKIISHFLEHIELQVTTESKNGLSLATKRR
jgi:hypothetical protein